MLAIYMETIQSLSFMSYLQHLEDQSIYILREAFANFKNMAMPWSMGKDSNT